ncbi:MAG: hypothetical protein QOE36_503 [Gaiellaceae bacterium]|nr:hypothetical protein [Gaiellaceae bacterium]
MPTDTEIPSDLLLLQSFVNTHELEEERDDIASAAGLAAWLADAGLGPRTLRATAADVRAAGDVREAIRVLLRSHNSEDVDTAPAAAVLERAARRARLELTFSGDCAAVIEPRATGAPAALGRIVAAVARASATDEWRRLKSCRAESCRWAFYDQARNQSRAWCSMKVCGNREKARIYRERHLK